VDAAHRVHRHGHYEHFADCDSAELEAVPRFLCILCWRTISVVPDRRLPYRSVDLAAICRGFDRAFCGGPDPPPGSEKEQGCVRRALRSFESHSPALRTALGQIVRDVGADAAALWRTLRRLNETRPILHFLQEKLKPLKRDGKRRGFGLLGTYRCLASQPCSSA